MAFNQQKFLILSLIAILLISSTCLVEAKKKPGKGGKGGPGGMGGMGGGAFGDKKTQMIFITIRDGYIIKEGIEKMAKDFQSIMSTGGI